MDFDDEEKWIHIDTFFHASDRMQAVLECLYGDRDEDELEDHLEEVCAVLDVQFPYVKKEREYEYE